MGGLLGSGRGDPKEGTLVELQMWIVDENPKGVEESGHVYKSLV